jgi:hypothetical protein
MWRFDRDRVSLKKYRIRYIPDIEKETKFSTTPSSGYVFNKRKRNIHLGSERHVGYKLRTSSRVKVFLENKKEEFSAHTTKDTFYQFSNNPEEALVYTFVDSSTIATSKKRSENGVESDKIIISKVGVNTFYDKEDTSNSDQIDDIGFIADHKIDAYGVLGNIAPSILSAQSFDVVNMLSFNRFVSGNSLNLKLIRREIFNENSFAVIKPPTRPKLLEVDIPSNDPTNMFYQSEITHSCQLFNFNDFFKTDHTINVFCSFYYQ